MQYKPLQLREEYMGKHDIQDHGTKVENDNQQEKAEIPGDFCHLPCLILELPLTFRKIWNEHLGSYYSGQR